MTPEEGTASNQFAYIDGQLRPSHPALSERYAAESERAVREGQPELDLPYGPHPRQTLDLFRTAQPRRGTVAYFHAGYWQSRDKSGFRFLAPALTADGFDVALVNYPLGPEASVAEITAAARAALPALADLTGHAPLILAGHSAGAQLAIDLAMDPPAGAPAIAGILAISGVFDLEPLLGTTVNARLGLDPATARAASPLHRVLPGGPHTAFAVGALETEAFRNQTAAMTRAWAEAGNPATEITVADADHFSILATLCSEDGPLRAAIDDLRAAVPAA